MEQNPISTVMRESLEKFDEKFTYLVEMDNPSTGATTTRHEEVKSFLTSSHRTLLETMLKEVEKLKAHAQELENISPSFSTKGYMQSCDDIAALLREALQMEEYCYCSKYAAAPHPAHNLSPSKETDI